jgi:hypothetical protein
MGHAKTVHDPVLPRSCYHLDPLAASRQLPCIRKLVSFALHAELRLAKHKALAEITSAFFKAFASLIETWLGTSRKQRGYGTHDQSRHSLFHFYCSAHFAAKPHENISDIPRRETALIRFARLDHSRVLSHKLHTPTFALVLYLWARLLLSLVASCSLPL